MRRITLDEPLAWTAVWSRGCAVFALTVAVIGVIMARKGLDPTSVIAIEAGAMLIAVGAVLFAVVAMVVIWRTGYRGTGFLVAGLLIAGLTLAYPLFLVVQSRRLTPLPDVSTDPADPPRFSSVPAAVSARGGKTPPAAIPLAQQELQARLYPDLQSLVLDVDPPEAFAAIEKILARRHWRITDQEVPLAEAGSGRIDAVASSLIMGFPADVTIRIKPQGGQSLVDIRSVSRTRWHEPDADARRVEALAAEIEDAVDQE